MIKVDDEHAQLTIARVYQAGQEQVFRFWDELDDAGRAALLAQVETIDFRLLKTLVTKYVERPTPLPGTIRGGPGGASLVLEPPDVIELPKDDVSRARDAEARRRGLEAIAAGTVAPLLVAGGQATRLGVDGPKGLVPIGPVTGKSLIQLFAEQIRAAAARGGLASLPWYVMTSEATDAGLRAAFAEAGQWGLPADDVFFLKQRDLPAVNVRGKAILADKNRIATAPNGHGGLLLALSESGALEDMRRRGVEHVFSFQVDNPLCAVLDPVFVGHHVTAGAEMGTKVVEKKEPDEKVGLVVRRPRQPGLSVVEYSEIDEANRVEREEDGRLRFRAGNAAIHTFSVSFLERACALDLGYHAAQKKVRTVNRKGERIDPSEANGLKFELFLFDAMPHADPAIAQEIARQDEFSPVKNARGADTADTARRALIDRAARWIESAGGAVPRDDNGRPTHAIEIGPLTALDREAFEERFGEKPPTIDGDVAL